MAIVSNSFYLVQSHEYMVPGAAMTAATETVRRVMMDLKFMVSRCEDPTLLEDFVLIVCSGLCVREMIEFEMNLMLKAGMNPVFIDFFPRRGVAG